MYVDVVLVVCGFVLFLCYRIFDIGYNWKINMGRVFNYFCFGVVCFEVEIDCFMGDY